MRIKPDVIVAFAFGKFDDNDKPTCPNRIIADFAEYLAAKNMVPIVTQTDVPIIHSVMGIYFVDLGRLLTIGAKEIYLSTLSIAEKTKELAKEKGWKTVSVVAAAPHKWRCERDLRKMGFVILEEMYFNRYRFWFSRKSKQWWTRGPIRWWFYEILVRLLPWWLYKKIA